MTIAVTGAGGQLGSELCRRLGERATGLAYPDFDLTNRNSIERTLYSLQPEAIINCAAYTQVDKAETERDLCRVVNGTSVGILAEVCEELDIPLVQISTDYVFGSDAERNSPYSESDKPNPQGTYGLTKLEGETLASNWKKHFIVRTCGLYSWVDEGPVRGRNFVDTMISLGRERDKLNVVADQICAPTFVPHLCEAIENLLKTKEYGTYHVTNSGEVSWFAFAKLIFELSGLAVQVTPITTAQYNAPAPRPAYSVLDNSRLREVTGSGLPTWQQGLVEYLQNVREKASC